VAVLSLLLALTIAGICFLRKPVLRAEGRSALVALGWMAFLAGWGIWGGASHAPLVVAGNVLGGMALLAAVWRVFLAASPAAAAGGNAGRGAIWGLRVGLALLVMQIVLGSWLGGSRAMLECAMAGRCMEAMAGVLFLHRFSGFGVAAVLAVSALFAAQLAPGCRSGVKRLLASLAGVLLLGLGGAAIGPPLMFAVLHNLAVALTFAFAAGLLRQLRRT
jgi:heme A synthase